MSVEVVTSEKPRYKLLAPFYVEDNYLAEGLEINWTGPPNEQMQPLNKAAEERMLEYLKTLQGGKTPRVEDLVYVAMVGRPREGAEISLPHALENVPQMPNMPGSTPRPVESQLSNVVVPAAPVRPKKLMGTIKEETPNEGASL